MYCYNYMKHYNYSGLQSFKGINLNQVKPKIIKDHLLFLSWTGRQGCAAFLCDVCNCVSVTPRILIRQKNKCRIDKQVSHTVAYSIFWGPGVKNISDMYANKIQHRVTIMKSNKSTKYIFDYKSQNANLTVLMQKIFVKITKY